MTDWVAKGAAALGPSIRDGVAFLGKSDTSLLTPLEAAPPLTDLAGVMPSLGADAFEGVDVFDLTILVRVGEAG